MRPRALLLLVLLFSFNTFAIRGSTQENYNQAYKKSVVSLHKLNAQNELVVICTGTIISETEVLTAAHCFDDKNFQVQVTYQKSLASAISIKINNHYKRTNIYDPDWGYLYEVKLENDFAILNFPPIFKEIDFVSIPSQNPDLVVGDKITFSGYGQDANIFGMGSGGGVFRVSLPGPIKEISTERLRVEDGSSGICLGDSGGPAWSTNEENEITQVGIISQGDCNVLSMVERINWDKILEAQYTEYMSTTNE